MTVTTEGELPMDEPKTCLEIAAAVVDGPRQDNYGHPLANHRRIAAFWTTRLSDKLLPGEVIEPHEAAAMMRLVKEARLMHTPGHPDSLIDLCGYARAEEMIHEKYEDDQLAQDKLETLGAQLAFARATGSGS